MFGLLELLIFFEIETCHHRFQKDHRHGLRGCRGGLLGC